MTDVKSIPHSPGCYLFMQKKRIIYIGKAKDLRKRVSSYFQKKHDDTKTQLLVDSIDAVDFLVTDNEVEALILENNLIKKHQPYYNINLKDAKRYAYIQLTDDKFPRLLLARKRTRGKFFGPFISATERDYVMRLVQRLFQIRTCKRMPKRACLRFHIKLCTAPCIANVSEEDYAMQVKRATRVMTGRIAPVVREMKKDMLHASSRQNFEHAMLLRDQVNALEFLSEKQNVERQTKYDEDIINYKMHNGKIYLILFNIYKGTLTNKQEFTFNWTHDFLEEFIVQFYSDNPVPKELVLPKAVEPAVRKYLENKRSTRVAVTVPKKGEKKQLLRLVAKNVEISFFGDMTKLDALQKDLKLHEQPEVIECIDISHLGGTAMVGSLVQFRNAKPDKSNYRRFKIRTVEQIDDFAAIAEVVRRRYARLKAENLQMPNLIIIDGGKGQLSAAVSELQKLYLKIPIISIAKKFEEIYFPGSNFPRKLDKKKPALKFVQEIRDEAHRFAIAYNRLLRKKETIK